MSDMKPKRGRPSNYSPELTRKICDAIASSSRGTKKLCDENPDWPSQDTLFTWLKMYPEFSEQYAQAKRCQVELLVDEILEIADDTSNDCLINEQGKITLNNQAISRARLKIETRKWLACKLVPKVYGNDNSSQLMNTLSQEEILKLRSDISEIERKHIREY